MMNRDEDLLKEIQNSRKETQKQFDTVKITIGTAGLLVALGLNTTWSDTSPKIWSLSVYKLVLILILISMFSVTASFFIKELMEKWLEKIVANGGPTQYQRFIVQFLDQRFHQKAARLYSFIHVHAPNWCISVFNHTASVSLLTAIATFAYLVICEKP